LLIRQPQVMLLDEPTAAMDEAAERLFIERFRTWGQGRTIVVATHRMRVLELVDRIVVIDQGQILLDQPKAAALATMQGAARSQAA
jgi:ATP-binding cassette subfamily C protein LapB